MRLPRKVVKFLQGLPDYIIMSGIFLIYFALMFSLIWGLAFIHNFLGGI